MLRRVGLHQYDYAKSSPGQQQVCVWQTFPAEASTSPERVLAFVVRTPASAPVGGGSCCPASADAMQQDDRDHARGHRLVLGETRVARLLLVEDPVSLLSRHGRRGRLVRVGTDLDGDGRIGDQVEVPVGVGVRARLGREDGELVTEVPIVDIWNLRDGGVMV